MELQNFNFGMNAHADIEQWKIGNSKNSDWTKVQKKQQFKLSIGQNYDNNDNNNNKNDDDDDDNENWFTKTQRKSKSEEIQNI